MQLDPTVPPKRQPKLRASCDRCGDSKLKCDRQHPACGRCSATGKECIYGVSKKSNRKKAAKRNDIHRPTLPLAVTSEDALQPAIEGERPVLTAFPSPPNSNVEQETDFPLGPFNEDWDFGVTDINEQDMPNLTQSDTRNLQGAEQGNSVPSVGMSHEHRLHASHDCYKEACAVSSSLSLQDSRRPRQERCLTMHDSMEDIPLDHILHVCRFAIERLGHLFDCPCARNPCSRLFYASIFARVMMLYRQSAGLCYTEGGLYDSTPRRLTLQSSVASTPVIARSLSSILGCAQPGLFAMDNGGVEAHNTPSPGHPTVLPTSMAVGSFQIDDQHVQALVKIQVVLSEMRRAGILIERFEMLSLSAHTSGSDFEPGLWSEGLYANLISWMKREWSQARTPWLDQLVHVNMAATH